MIPEGPLIAQAVAETLSTLDLAQDERGSGEHDRQHQRDGESRGDLAGQADDDHAGNVQAAHQNQRQALLTL